MFFQHLVLQVARTFRFVICNGCFVVLSPMFLLIGFYSNDPIFLELTAGWPVTQSLFHFEGTTGILKQLAKVLMFIGPTQLGTATWFLTCLFLVLVIHSSIVLLINRSNQKKEKWFIIFFLIIMCVLSELVSYCRPSVIYAIKCFPCMYVSFLLGVVCHDIKWKYLYSWWMGLTAIFLLILMSLEYDIEVSAGRIDNICIFMLASICGWILLKVLSNIVLRFRVLSSILSYLGKHTMIVLCLHVLCFKAASWIYICIYNLPKVLLASFHIIFDASELWKILYTIVGVGLPLTLYWLYDRVKSRVLRYGFDEEYRCNGWKGFKNV